MDFIGTKVDDKRRKLGLIISIGGIVDRFLEMQTFNAVVDAGSLEQVIAMEDRNQILASLDGDFGEGVAAFLEKRPPRYERRDG